MPSDGDEFSLGGGGSILVTMPDGTSITLENAEVTLGVSQESLDHYSLGSEGRAIRRDIIGMEYEIMARATVGKISWKGDVTVPLSGIRKVKFRKK